MEVVVSQFWDGRLRIWMLLCGIFTSECEEMGGYVAVWGDV